MQYPLSALYLASFAVGLICATLIAAVAPRSPARGTVVVSVYLMVAWSLADLLSNTATTAEGVRDLARATTFIWSSLPFLALRAAWLHSGRSRSLAFDALLALPAVACACLLFSGALHSQYLPASVNGIHFQARATAWQFAVNAYALVYLSVAWRLTARGADSGDVTGYLFLLSIPIVGVGGGILVLGGAPYLVSPLLGLLLVVTTAVFLRRRCFVSPGTALDMLSRREEVLGALPLGVAILEPDTNRVRYANPAFSELTGDAGELSLELASALSGRERQVQLGEGEGERVLELASRDVDYAGEPGRLLAVQDVTARVVVERELALQQHQRHQARRLESLGRLSAGLAHDYNNQLTVILSYSELAKQRAESELTRECLAEVIKASERAGALTRKLLLFARAHEQCREVLDINAVVESLLALIDGLLTSVVTVRLIKSPQPAWVGIDRVLLEQVLMTLATNAAEAMPQGGELTYSVGQEGDRIVLSVRDTGQGMPAEVQAHVFEPFFTTKGEDGTGLGLATVHGIVTQVGGEVAVASEVGEGTEFRLLFPCKERPSAKVTSREAPRKPVKRAATILLVEDDVAVRESVRTMLADGGYQVVEAGDGRDALEQLEGVELVLTDLSMPNLDGLGLIQRLRDERPSLPVVLMSGQAVLPKRSAIGVATLSKPFSRAELLDRVHEALAEL